MGWKKNLNLSPSEERVVILFCSGLTLQKVADILKLSVKTVQAHIQKVYLKCDLQSDLSRQVQLFSLFYSGEILQSCGEDSLMWLHIFLMKAD